MSEIRTHDLIRFNRYRRKCSKVDASIFNSALSHTRRKKRRKERVGAAFTFRLSTSFESSSVLVKLFLSSLVLRRSIRILWIYGSDNFALTKSPKFCFIKMHIAHKTLVSRIRVKCVGEKTISNFKYSQGKATFLYFYLLGPSKGQESP